MLQKLLNFANFVVAELVLKIMLFPRPIIPKLC